MRFSRFIALCAVGLLVGCSVTPPRVGGGLAQQDGAALGNFDLTGRFHLQVEPERQMDDPRQFAGRLEWQHGLSGDRLLFTDPMGQGVAELLSPESGQAVLILADGSRRESAAPESLLKDVLGVALPLTEMVSWVQARTGIDADVERDDMGRPLLVREAGWQLEYRYAGVLRLPSRIDAHLPGAFKLRLFIESWDSTP